MSTEAVLPAWLADPALARVWEAVRRRLEQTGLAPAGRVVVSDLDRAERHAVSGLLGAPVVADVVRIDLRVLDAALRERAGRDVATVVLLATGTAVRDRQAERSAGAARRDAPLAAARLWLAERPASASQPWLEDWLSGVRRSGLLTRVPAERSAPVLLQALAVLDVLTTAASAGALWSRSELAATHTGDAHGLEDDRPVGQLVIRGLAVAAGLAIPVSGADRRAVWERWGVAVDHVSTSCLTLGLRPVADGARERRLRLAADDGDPVHLTGWDLARLDLAVPAGTPVLVCENPRVLEAIAQRFRGNIAVVCGAGMPAIVVMHALRALAASGADLRYHGDFDWPGVAIANRLVAEVGVRPWLMSAVDYESAARADGLPLRGVQVEATWDPELAAVMRARGVAVHEEAVLASLVGALADR